MTSPSESTEPLKGIFTRDSKRWYINIKQPDRVEVVPLPEGAGGTVETLKSLLAQEYSRAVEDALKALPEERESVLEDDMVQAPEVYRQANASNNLTAGYNAALAEAREAIQKLKENN